MDSTGEKPGSRPTPDSAPEEDFGTLKYQLLGPSLTKAGQDSVDQQKVRLIVVCLWSYG
jgi:DNA polymerase kappa